jgi:phosphoadenosine phosphosulfate reductase
MHVTMVKKRLASGEPCPKCIQAEDLLKARGLWPRIDEVVWADEADAASAGMALAVRFGVNHAPFFMVRGEGEGEGEVVVYESVLKLIKERLTTHSAQVEPNPAEVDFEAEGARLEAQSPSSILRWGLERYGASLGIAFSGAEDVVLVHMARETRLPFSVFCLDTGRLHPETYRFVDLVRKRYEIEIALISPDASSLETFVRKKGLFSFYEDGHQECCGVRKIEPLRRTLATLRAWATGQRRDQSPATRSSITVVERDRTFSAAEGGPLVKLNPLAAWTSAQTWQYIRDHDIPYNALHGRGFVSIGCEPCTRATLPGEHERAGRWWWEESTKRECGLHIGNVAAPQ